MAKKKNLSTRLITKDELIEALNRIDELADIGAGEEIEIKKQLAKDYNLLFLFIDDNK